MEDGTICGGLGSAVMEWLNDHSRNSVQVHRIGIPDAFIAQGTVPQLRKLCGMDAESITAKIKELLNSDK